MADKVPSCLPAYTVTQYTVTHRGCVSWTVSDWFPPPRWSAKYCTLKLNSGYHWSTAHPHNRWPISGVHTAMTASHRAPYVVDTMTAMTCVPDGYHYYIMYSARCACRPLALSSQPQKKRVVAAVYTAPLLVCLAAIYINFSTCRQVSALYREQLEML